MRNFGGVRRFEEAGDGWEKDPGMERTGECPCYSPSVIPTEACGQRERTSKCNVRSRTELFGG